MKSRPNLLCWFIFSIQSPLLFAAVPAREAPAALLQLADQLYRDQNYDASITEYRRFLFFHPHHPYSFYAYYKTGMAHKQLQEWEPAVALLRRALQQNIPPQIRQRMRYQLALTLMSQGDFNIAQLELFKLIHTDSPGIITQAAALLYGLLLMDKQDWPEARSAFGQARSLAGQNADVAARLEEIESHLQNLAEHPAKKSPKLAKWLSTFVPGSGQIYAGSVLSGLNALALNAGTSYLLWQSIDRRNVRDAVLLFSFIWLRYYTGNRLHAEEAAIRANQTYQEAVLLRIYDLLRQASSCMPAESLIVEWHHLPAIEE